MFSPCNDNLLITTSQGERQTASGIILTSDESVIVKGTVVKAGPGHLPQTVTPSGYGDARLPMTVQEGDTVWFAKSHASTLRLDGTDYRLVAERNVFGFERN